MAEHPLKNSWIYDLGLDQYICNSSMQHCFYDYEEIYMNDYVFNGIIMLIKGYEKINIKIIKGNKLCIMTFFKVIYIFNYSMNLVLMSRVEIKRMYWDNEHKKFIKNKKLFFDIKTYGSHY